MDTMKSKTCCFTGHRKIPHHDLEKIKKHLAKEVENLINQGVCYFGAGGALGFDTLAAQTVLKLKKIHPHIKLILVLPCKDWRKFWQPADILESEQILSKADKVVFLSETYHKDCTQKRNHHLVNFSDYCLCYLTKAKSGTGSTVNYAKTKGLKIIPVGNKPQSPQQLLENNPKPYQKNKTLGYFVEA